MTRPFTLRAYDTADYFHELTQPHAHVEKYLVRSGARWVQRQHTTKAPALVTQLWANDIPSAAVEGTEGTRPGYGSKPAARLDALDTAARIHTEAASWLRELGKAPAHHGTRRVLLQLHGLLPGIAVGQERRRVERDVRGWWAQARVVTGWDSPAWNPDATCPSCGMRGSLKVRLADRLAVCTSQVDGVSCGAVWNEISIGVLAEHIRLEVEGARRTQVARGPCVCPWPAPRVADLSQLCPRCGSARCRHALAARLLDTLARTREPIGA